MNIHTYTQTHICIQCMHKYTYKTYTHVQTRTNTFKYTFRHTDTQAYKQTYKYTCKDSQTCIHAYTYIVYIHAYTYIVYTHAYTFIGRWMDGWMERRMDE